MLTSRSRLFYVSPWLLTAATALLILIVVTFALSNLQREKKLMTDAMIQKAVTIMRIVHSGARASTMAELRTENWELKPWNEHVQQVIDHVSEDPDILYLGVLDRSGEVIAHSNKAKINTKSSFQLPLQKGGEDSDETLNYRITQRKQSKKIFEAVRLYVPFRAHLKHMLSKSWAGMRQNYPMMGRNNSFRQQQEQINLEPDPYGPYYLVIGLDMSEFDRSLNRIKFQVVILSITMLLVGLGGWLSLSAVQGYRVSQQTLQEIQAFTGHLIAKLPVGIIATDKDGRITTWNSVASEMTGLKSKQTVGKLPDNVLPAQLKGFFQPEVNGLLVKNDKGKKQEIIMQSPAGDQVLFGHLIDIRDAENFYLGKVLLLSNLTDLKRLEKEMRENERLAAIGRMAAGVAHEVRNPLSTIKGLALLLKSKFSRESKEEETTGLLIQEVERMNRTISELLSFARPASLDLQRVKIGELLSEELKLMEPDTVGNGIEAALRLDDDLKEVAGDPDRLKQVFMNVLLNAVQAMAAGGRLEVSAKNGPEGNHVEVTISDSGCGIEETVINQVFFPYFTTKPGGTGIGLAISQKIVFDHRGTIRIRSEQGKGTAVIITLPVFS